MKGHGKWWLYFNSRAAAPLVWCVAPAGRAWEVAVVEVLIGGLPCRTAFGAAIGAPFGMVLTDPCPAPPFDAPTAWIEVEGMLAIDGSGRATITP